MKTLKKVAVVVLACLCAIVCLIGCADQTYSVDAGTLSYEGDYISKKYDTLELKVKFKSAHATPWGTSFYSKSTLPELKEQIDKQRQKGYSLETTLYGERYLLIDKTKDGHVYHYLVVRRAQTESGGWRYDFMNTEEMISVGNADREYVVWLIPYHLLGDVAYEEILNSSGGYFDFKANRTYPSEHGIDDFYEFYKVIEYCYVSKEGNVITLERIGNGQKYAISIRFDETDAGTTVTYFNSVFVE